MEQHPTEAPSTAPTYGERVRWSPQAPRFTVLGLLVAWLVSGTAVFVTAAIVPGVSVQRFVDALFAAALIAALNAVLPPLVAALSLPFTLALGFPMILLLDAAMLMLASAIDSNAIHVTSFGWALVASILIAAVIIVLQ